MFEREIRGSIDMVIMVDLETRCAMARTEGGAREWAYMGCVTTAHAHKRTRVKTAFYYRAYKHQVSK